MTVLRIPSWCDVPVSSSPRDGLSCREPWRAILSVVPAGRPGRALPGQWRWSRRAGLLQALHLPVSLVTHVGDSEGSPGRQEWGFQGPGARQLPPFPKLKLQPAAQSCLRPRVYQVKAELGPAPLRRHPGRSEGPTSLGEELSMGWGHVLGRAPDPDLFIRGF